MLAALEGIKKSYGTDVVFEDVNLAVHEGDRIGFVGANGTGKTTLLNVLAKNLPADEGNVIYKSGLTVGYMRQNSGLRSGNTIIGEMRSVYADAIAAHKKMEQLAEALAEQPDDPVLVKEYDQAQAVYEAHDGYGMDVNIKKVLNGMGFSDMQLDMAIDGMSGGEKTRLALARLLLMRPGLLMLDEPTNHLDFATLGWLEGYLSQYRGAMLVVSHDRYFLDKVSTKIWEIDDLEITEYKGNYSAYKLQKAEHTEYRLKEYEKQRNRMESMEDYARRNIARASTSKMAKSRLKQLEHIEPIKKPRTRVKQPSFSFEFDKKPVNDVLHVEDLALRVGEERRQIVGNISLDLKRAERLAVIGANGTGKSTLLKALMDIGRQTGVIEWGRNTTLGYYDQENKDMKPELAVIDELWRRFPELREQEVRGMLGRVLITGEEVYKQVRSLSGGERAKLGLAILMAGRYNVLVLDEPTNHLDLPAREALEGALKKYEGTLVFVSHDRYFVNALCTRILEIEDGIAKGFVGSFDEYMEKKKAVEAPPEDAPEQSKAAAAGKQASQRETRRQQAQIRQKTGELEKRMAELEAEEKDLEELIAGNPSDFELLAEKCARLELVKAEHEALMEEWVELA